MLYYLSKREMVKNYDCTRNIYQEKGDIFSRSQLMQFIETLTKNTTLNGGWPSGLSARP